MNTELNQKISQLLDDDLHLLEQQQILRKISKQEELMSKLNRYHAISHVLQKNDFVMADNDFLAKVNKGLENESAHSVSQPVMKKRTARFWTKTSLALAASVAVVSVLVSQQLQVVTPSIQANSTLLIAEQQPVEEVVAGIVSHKAINKQKEDQLAAIQHERLKAYLQAHSNDLYTHGTLNIQPHVQMAGFNQE